ncbi:MAG: bifunctional nuclease family protein [Pseudobdellovibrio sp.]
MKADFLFPKEQNDLLNFNDEELVELKAYGLSLTNEQSRPFLILKDSSGDYTLPVAISQIEAGVAITQANPHQLASTPHIFLEKLIESLDIKIEKCVFVEISGHHQFVRIFMSGHPRYQSLKLRADEAMSLCIHLKVPFYSTKSFIHKSKVMTSKIPSQAENVLLEQMGLNPRKELFH